MSVGSATIKTLLDADGTNAQIRVALVGYSITDDFNLGAEKVMLHIGDSITAGVPAYQPNTKCTTGKLSYTSETLGPTFG